MTNVGRAVSRVHVLNPFGPNYHISKAEADEWVRNGYATRVHGTRSTVEITACPEYAEEHRYARGTWVQGAAKGHASERMGAALDKYSNAPRIWCRPPRNRLDPAYLETRRILRERRRRDGNESTALAAAANQRMRNAQSG